MRRYLALQLYESAASTCPLLYFGYSGYEHIGKLRSPAVTLMDLPGAMPFSTQSVSSATRSNVFGIGRAAMFFPSPSVV